MRALLLGEVAYNPLMLMSSKDNAYQSRLQFLGNWQTWILAACLVIIVHPALGKKDKDGVFLDVYEDIDLGIWTGRGDLDGEADVCIGSSSLAFTIKGTGPNTKDDGDRFFSIKGPKGSKLPVSLYYVSNQTTVELEPHTEAGPIRTDATAQDCADHHIASARLRAVIREQHLAGSPAGSYSGKVNLIVKAE